MKGGGGCVWPEADYYLVRFDDPTARAGPHEREAHEQAQARESEWLEIGLGAQILKELGVTSIRLFASRERHYVGLEGFGIRISGTEIVLEGRGGWALPV